MHNCNLPATLNPCVRIFLEMLCGEAMALTPADFYYPVIATHEDRVNADLLAFLREAQKRPPEIKA
jgi:hypothetical protein